LQDPGIGEPLCGYTALLFLLILLTLLTLLILLSLLTLLILLTLLTLLIFTGDFEDVSSKLLLWVQQHPCNTLVTPL
jgi:hypothetical protein